MLSSVRRRRNKDRFRMSTIRISRWRLPLVSILISAALAGAFYGVARDSLLQQSGVLIVAEPAVVEFRAPDDCNVVDVRVTLRNIAGSLLRLVGVSTSCSCLVPVSQFPLILAPGEKRVIHFQVEIDDEIRTRGGTMGRAEFLVEVGSPPIVVEFSLLPGSDSTAASTRFVRPDLSGSSESELAKATDSHLRLFKN